MLNNIFQALSLKAYLVALTLLVSSAPLIADSQKPSTVNGLSGNALSSNSIRLTWNKPWDDTGVDGYNVYRNDHYYTTVWDTNLVDNDVSARSSYRYYISAFDGSRNYSDPSATVTVVTTDNNSAPPAPANQGLSVPTNLRSQVISANEIKLLWNQPSSGNTKGYNVYRNDSYYTSTNNTSYTDNNVAANTQYTYSVVAYDDNGNYSNQSSNVVANANGGTGSSASSSSSTSSSPNGLNGDYRDNSHIHLTWNPPTSGSVNTYKLFRNGNLLTTTSNLYYDDWSVNSNSKYTFLVQATDQYGGTSPSSNSISITTTDGANQTNSGNAQTTNNQNTATNSGPLVAAGNMRSEVLDPNRVRLHWDRPTSGNAAGYNVYQNDAYMSTIYGTSYDVPWIESGNDYHYYVIAFDNSNNYSAKSERVYVNTGTPRSNAGGTSVPGGYNLIFSDEFNSYSLDSNKWNSQYRWGPNLVINNEKQYYVDWINNPDFGHSPFEFDGQHLTINAIKTPDWLKSSANWQPYLSGMLNTYNKFRMKYGYVEMRAKMPKGRGVWPAFWLLNQNDWDRKPEIDVVEMLGHQPNLVYHTYHYYENGWSLRSTPSFESWGPDYTEDFHVYGMKWEPGRITWYVDGKEAKVLNDGNTSWEDMYLIVNMAIGGNWPGDPDGSTAFPARMSIDYIRAYQP